MTLKTGRKLFTNNMQLAKAPKWIIALHQGRASADVMEKSYLDDDPIRVCKPYIDKMFEEENKLKAVK